MDSEILQITNISKDNFKEINEEEFFKTIKAGFSSKRKKLSNNIPKLANNFDECNIGGTARAEELSLENWLCLTKHA